MRKKLEFQHYVREALKDYMNEGLCLGEILESFYNPELTTAANRLYEEFEADIWDILRQRAMELGQAAILATIPERSLLSMCDFRKHLFYTALIYELERIAKEEKADE